MPQSSSRTIFFFIRSAGYLKTYRSVICALLARGFSVTAAFDPSPRELDTAAIRTLDAFVQEHTGFSWVRGVRRGGIWKRILRPVREILNYRRFLLLPERARFYETLCFKFLPHTLQKVLRAFPPVACALKSRIVEVLLKSIEWFAPPASGIVAQIAKSRPVAVLVAFRNRPSSSPDLDYIKAAKALRIPVVIPTPSWDNLSSKGLIQILPDLLLVWNEEQVNEAVTHHRIPHARIRIVGAYQFDDWCALTTPHESRNVFCRRVGIPSEEPYIVYLGSGSITGDSTAVIDELRHGLDESGISDVARVRILVRPAPNNFIAFDGYRREKIALFPHSPVSLATPEGVEILFTTIYYALAAVTIHTTGIIDAMLKGKPGLVMLRGEYAALQSAEHFAHLLKSGAVEVFRTGEEFGRSVAALLAGKDKHRSAREAFIRSMIRPRGTERSAGECAADEIEKLIQEKTKIV